MDGMHVTTACQSTVAAPASSTLPNITPSCLRRGSAPLNRDDILRLICECDATLAREPDCLHTHAVRGHACVKAKLYEQAIVDFSAILQQRPDDIHGRFSRGMALFKNGRLAEAHADFTRVLELNPHHVMARYARAGCYNTEGKFNHAIQEYTIALQHDEKENDYGRASLRAHDALLRGWYQDAERKLRRLEQPELYDIGKPLQRLLQQANGPRRIQSIEEPLLKPEPISTIPQTSSMVTASGDVAKEKKARRVVQVKLNLTPTGSGAPQNSTLNNTPSSATTEDARLSVSPPVSSQQIAVARTAPTHVDLHAASPTTRNQIKITPTASQPVSQQPPTNAQVPTARRIVRRVTVAL